MQGMLNAGPPAPPTDGAPAERRVLWGTRTTAAAEPGGGGGGGGDGMDIAVRSMT